MSASSNDENGSDQLVLMCEGGSQYRFLLDEVFVIRIVACILV